MISSSCLRSSKSGSPTFNFPDQRFLKVYEKQANDNKNDEKSTEVSPVREKKLLFKLDEITNQNPTEMNRETKSTENSSINENLVYDRTENDLDTSKVSLYEADMKIEVENPRIVNDEGELQFLLRKFDSNAEGEFFEKEGQEQVVEEKEEGLVQRQVQLIENGRLV